MIYDFDNEIVNSVMDAETINVLTEDSSSQQREIEKRIRLANEEKEHLEYDKRRTFRNSVPNGRMAQKNIIGQSVMNNYVEKVTEMEKNPNFNRQKYMYLFLAKLFFGWIALIVFTVLIFWRD